MSSFKKPCLDCGELCQGSRCYECLREHENRAERRSYVLDGPRTRLEGHKGKEWVRLSKKARRAQPWCSMCGANDDLTTDHSEQAWAKYYAGQKIEITDVDVLCRSCNSKKGTSRAEFI